MRTIFLLIILQVLLLQSCLETTSKDPLKEKKVDHLKEDKKEVELKTLFQIKNKDDYSKSFLNQFRDSHAQYDRVQLISDSLIINHDSTNVILFPAIPKLHKKYSLSQKKNDLTFTKINYSTLEYVFQNEVNSIEGFLNLNPRFYYPSEKTIEDLEGTPNPMNHYFEEIGDSTVSIFISPNYHKIVLFEIMENDKVIESIEFILE